MPLKFGACGPGAASSGDIVRCGAKTAGDNAQLGPAGNGFDHPADVIDVIAYRRHSMNAKAQLHQLPAQPGGIGIHNVPKQDLVSGGQDF
jgi:hypothetical protein